MNRSVLNGLLWVAWYERVCFEWEPFWIIVIFLWVTSFKLFTVIGFSAKAPTYWRWWWQLHMLQQCWPQKWECKLYEMILKFSGLVESLINNAPPDRDGRNDEARILRLIVELNGRALMERWNALYFWSSTRFRDSWRYCFILLVYLATLAVLEQFV